jgi:hypothetical protein
LLYSGIIKPGLGSGVKGRILPAVIQEPVVVLTCRLLPPCGLNSCSGRGTVDKRQAKTEHKEDSSQD